MMESLNTIYRLGKENTIMRMEIFTRDHLWQATKMVRGNFFTVIPKIVMRGNSNKIKRMDMVL